MDNADQGDEPIETRICYGSRDAHPLVSWSEDNGKKLKEGLTIAYRYISNRILTEMVGLAPDPEVIQTWDKTALTCVVYKEEPYKPIER